MGFTVAFEQRDFSGPLAVGGLGLEVEWMTWRALGGPWQALVKAKAGSMAELWGLADLLRCGVTVFDQHGECWWGYVSAVELRDSARVVRVGLDEMWNRIMVRYRDVSPSEAGGLEHFSTWVSDLESVRNYGTKEIILDGGQGTLADANGIAAARLSARSQPVVQPFVDYAAAEYTGPFAVIECRGWWETLDWQYYSQGRGQSGNLHGGASCNVGTSAVQRVAAAFASTSGTWLVSEVWLRVKKVLAVDSLVVQVCTNSAGLPGTVLASGSIAAASLEDESTWVRVELNTPVSLGASALHLVLSRSGSISDANYFTTSVDEGLRFAVYSLIYYNGAAWAVRVPDADLTFLLAGVEDTGTQADAMISAGQFITGCRLAAVSGISGRLYRDGSRRIREEAEQQLEVGGTLARVNRARYVEIYAKPSEEKPAYQIGADGRLLLKDGREAEANEQAAGEWARVEYGGAVWLEQVRWEAGQLRVGSQ